MVMWDQLDLKNFKIPTETKAMKKSSEDQKQKQPKISQLRVLLTTRACFTFGSNIKITCTYDAIKMVVLTFTFRLIMDLHESVHASSFNRNRQTCGINPLHSLSESLPCKRKWFIFRSRGGRPFSESSDEPSLSPASAVQSINPIIQLSNTLDLKTPKKSTALYKIMYAGGEQL